METQKRAVRREKIGTVVSDKMAKTITVTVQRRMIHGKYKKFFTRTGKFYAHDEKEEAKIGDKVLIFETEPISRLKRWRLGEVIKKSNEAAGVE